MKIDLSREIPVSREQLELDRKKLIQLTHQIIGNELNRNEPPSINEHELPSRTEHDSP